MIDKKELEFAQTNMVSDFLDKTIKESLRPYIGELLTVNTRQKIKNTTEYTLIELIRMNKGNNDDMVSLKYEVLISNGNITINPGNLFTFMIMHGVYVPSAVLKDKTSYETDDGEYIYSENGCSYKPKTPLHYITFNYDIGGNDDKRR